MKHLKTTKELNELSEKSNMSDVSYNLDDMTSSEIKRYIMNNFVATKSNLEKLVDDTKDLTKKEMMYISYSLGMTAGGLYCIMMENKYGIKVPI